MSIRTLLLSLLALVAACGPRDAGSPGGRTPPAHEAAAVPAPPAPPPTAPPVVDSAVRFETSDGVTIAATLRVGATPDAPAVILVHKLSSTRAEWAPLLAKLSERPALTTLAIDLRGHGESTHGPSGRVLAWDSFTAEDWRATSLDVRAAVDYLAAHAPVHPSRIAAVGASIGSSAVIAAAADEPRVVAIVALSPGRAYHGFDAITPATHLGARPVMALAAADETEAVDMANTLARISPRGVVLVVDGNAHGVDIFQSAPAMLDRVDDFLRTALTPPPPSVTPPADTPPAPPGTITTS